MTINEYTQQINIQRIDMMPNLPSPFLMRNWKNVATGYDSLVFNKNLTGNYLPLVWTDNNSINYPGNSQFGLHTVVGTPYPSSAEAINCIPAVIGASLNGIDKQNQNGINWVRMCAEWFNKANGLNVYKNHPDDMTYDDWWYETMPNVFFYELNYLYPGTDLFGQQFTIVADRWLDAVKAMGGSTTPWSIPNMDHRGWDLSTMQPYDPNAGINEPEAAGAIAWILYSAYEKTLDEKYRIGAEWCLEYLNSLTSNPSYELQLSYGVYTAARMNAEIGTTYDIAKMINWCFDVGPLRSWGAMANSRWGGYDADGLIGEVNGSNDYAFAMNTFEQIGTLVPMVRYDPRFAAAIGKWVLNAANACRLFYPKYLPVQNQDQPSKLWSDQYDSGSYIGHEAIREFNPSNFSVSPFASGDAISGGWGNTNLTLYGSSHVGILGAIIDTTNVEGILQLDLLKTDYYHENAYPSFLFYNPYNVNKLVNINVGTGINDIYDAVSKTTIASGVTGMADISIPALSAVLAVIVPSNGNRQYQGDKYLINGIVVDYHSGNFSGNVPPRIKSLSSDKNVFLFRDSSNIYCTAVSLQNYKLNYQWSVSGGEIYGSGSSVLYTAPDTEGTYNIFCKVTDEVGNSVSASESIKVVANINLSPSIQNLEANPRKINIGGNSVIKCNAVDSDGDKISYSWSSEYGSISGSGESIIWTAPAIPGNYYIKCIVSDTGGSSDADSILTEVRDFSINQTGSLVAKYPFNGNANDLSGNNNNGSVFNATLTTDREGNPNSAYYFNGTNGYIQVPSSVSLNFTQGITVSFWMKIGKFFSREQYIISHGSYNNRWKISIIPEKKIRWTIKTNSSLNGGISDLDSETLLKLDSVYNITAAFNGSDAELYINGNLDAFKSWTGLFSPTIVPLTIGQMLPNDNNYNFNGVLDDISIYNYGLPFDMIKALYAGPTSVNQENNNTAPATTSLLQNYPNPFNPSTRIGFILEKSSFVSLDIYNVIGQKVKSLIKGNLNAGAHYITWDAADFPSGVYLCSLAVNGNVLNKKMILIK